MYIKLSGLGGSENGVVCTSPNDCNSGTCCTMPNGFAYCMSDPAACLQMISSCVLDPTMAQMPICKISGVTVPPVPVPPPVLGSCPTGYSFDPTKQACVPNAAPPPVPPPPQPKKDDPAPKPAAANLIFGMTPMVAGAVGLVAVLVGIKVFKGGFR